MGDVKKEKVIKIRLDEGDYFVTPTEILAIDGEFKGERVTFEIEGIPAKEVVKKEEVVEKKAVDSVSGEDRKGKQKFWFASKEDAEKAGEVFAVLMAGTHEFYSPVKIDKRVRGVLRLRDKKYGTPKTVECIEEDVAWLLMQFFDWIKYGYSLDYLLALKGVHAKEDWVEIEWEKIERVKAPKEPKIYRISEKRIDGREWRITEA